MSPQYPSNDSELRQRVRDLTSYEDTADELPQTQLEGIVDSAKSRLELETGTDQWYSDDGITFALVAYTCMRSKAAVENVPLASYSIGDEQVSFDGDEPEDSAQYQQWAEDVRIGLDASDADSNQGLSMRNTSSYIGDDHLPHRDKTKDHLR